MHEYKTEVAQRRLLYAGVCGMVIALTIIIIELNK